MDKTRFVSALIASIPLASQIVFIEFGERNIFFSWRGLTFLAGALPSQDYYYIREESNNVNNGSNCAILLETLVNTHLRNATP